MKKPDNSHTVPIQNSYSNRVGTLKELILAGPEHSDNTKDNTKEQSSEEKKK